MSAPPLASGPAPIWPLYRAMVGVGLLCGLLIVGVYQLTLPVIARNRAEALERAVFRVLPGARSQRSFAWREGGGFEAAESGAAGQVHAGYDETGRLVGLAVEGSALGYADAIRVLYGYAPEAGAVVGMAVLETRETPGLGDRIETDPAFLANFERLEVPLDAGGEAVLHPIEAVKPGEKQHAWQVEGITGATISSVAVARALAGSTGRWVPRIERHLDALGAAPPGGPE